MKYRNLVALITLAILTNGCGGSSDEVVVLGGDSDNCPSIINSDQTDTDMDGMGDICDSDDDNDGFLDEDDSAPLDKNIPGDFSSVEAILSNPLIQKGLAEAKASGNEVIIQTGLNPPNITGYYKKLYGSGVVSATSTGENVGGSFLGAESYINNTQSAHVVNFKTVNFLSDQVPVSYSISKGTLLRGEGSKITTYAKSKRVCTEDGANFESYWITLSSSTFDALSGKISGTKRFQALVDTQGVNTEVCVNRLPGNSDQIGSWNVNFSGDRFAISVSDLEYMCVHEEVGYVPTEEWTDSSGIRCECTTDYDVSCS